MTGTGKPVVGREAAVAPDGSTLAASASTIALESTAARNSRQSRTAGRRWARSVKTGRSGRELGRPAKPAGNWRARICVATAAASLLADVMLVLHRTITRSFEAEVPGLDSCRPGASTRVGRLPVANGPRAEHGCSAQALDSASRRADATPNGCLLHGPYKFRRRCVIGLRFYASEREGSAYCPDDSWSSCAKPRLIHSP